jgi:hypothetical protein
MLAGIAAAVFVLAGSRVMSGWHDSQSFCRRSSHHRMAPV